MAYEDSVTTISVPAAGALTQFTLVTVNSSGQVANTGDGAMAQGVVQNDPGAAGEIAEVATAGVMQVVAGGSVSAGDDIGSDANGQAVTASDGSGDIIIGKALTSASGSGSVISMLYQPTGALA